MARSTTHKSFPVEFRKGPSARTFSAVVSTASVDRDKDVIDPKGWRLASYRENPIVLWQHRRDLPPIARTTDIRVSGARLLASLEFPPEGASPLADEIHNLVAAGFLHSTSVGFLPIRSEYNHERGGHDILEAELLEWSIVNVPANHEALIQRCLGEACDRAAVDRWLKGAKSTRCACKTSLAEIPFVNGEFHFEDEHLYVTQSPATIARLTRGALRTAIKELIPQMIRREVNYMRGRID